MVRATGYDIDLTTEHSNEVLVCSEAAIHKLAVDELWADDHGSFAAAFIVLWKDVTPDPNG